MQTSTLAAIIDKMTAVIEGLTPAASPVDARFRRSPIKHKRLRSWCVNAKGSEVFRVFEVYRDGDRDDPGVMDPSATEINMPIRVTIAYPAELVALYGRDDLDDLEDVIESDARQIRDALFSPSNLTDGGHQASIVRVLAPDRSDEKVYFQDLIVTAKYFATQNL